MTNFLVMFVGIEFTHEALELGIACSRLSDSGKDAKVKGTRKSFFSCSRFFNPRGISLQGLTRSPPSERRALLYYLNA